VAYHTRKATRNTRQTETVKWNSRSLTFKHMFGRIICIVILISVFDEHNNYKDGCSCNLLSDLKVTIVVKHEMWST